MIYDRILVRYGELSLKKRNRRLFINKLKQNIKRVLKQFNNIKVEATYDRIYVILNGEDGSAIAHKLANVFGISSVSPVVKVEKDIDKMKEAALQLFKQVYKQGDTFKISARRADKTFPHNSNELNNMFGSLILKNNPEVIVDVKKPNINLSIEVRREAVYLSCETIIGAGGLPVGSSGKGMLMLSGGIDSPVAGYLAMKRGLQVEAIHFFSPPYTSERAKQKVIDLSEKLANVGGTVKLHIVPFTEIQQLISERIPDSYSMTTTRRLMLKIADTIRAKNNGLAIITGESLGQVASQTLESMYTINEVTNTPILRPLIAMDKSDIIRIAKEIETYEISIRPYEDCCTVFVPDNPKTNPRRDKVNHFEGFVEFDSLIEKAVNNTETISINIGAKSQNESFEDLF